MDNKAHIILSQTPSKIPETTFNTIRYNAITVFEQRSKSH